MNIRPIARALISVSDKTGLIEAANALVEQGVALISTGGTAKALAQAGLPVVDVADITGFPEMMDGRVKTLHPRVHGGLLALRDDKDHAAAMEAHGIEGIDLLWVNLYPFEATLASGADFETCVENIDIGGPAMIRAAAKNYAFCAVATDLEDVQAILADITAHGGSTEASRKRLAAKAYARTAAYDCAISNWYAHSIGEAAPVWRGLGGQRVQALRYGENPHQSAAFYATNERRAGVATAKQLQGKELSYNNFNDTDAAYELIGEFDHNQHAAIAIIKHANPCGVALGEDLRSAYLEALACDPVSAFGGIVACNRTLDGAAAEEMVKIFTEVVIAPDADADAIAIFAQKKNLRLLLAGSLPDPQQKGLVYKTLAGGFLVQDRDCGQVRAQDLQIATARKPSAQEVADMLFAFTVAKHVKSNAIVFAKDGVTAGIGAGQMNRRDSARIATLRAKEAAETAHLPHSRTIGSACASDAFFPFADGLLQAIEAGATAVIQPGGSIRDPEVIAAADAAGITMAFTGMRHFRH
ncbi:MAG: phosphoribosylaminoimidazolecarboxamide formyltransferase [Pseudomonadota bacterium]|jgi:phosphoribosylaminoimidazolecarboxamide formyltransferase/IMP cyclohydrolase